MSPRVICFQKLDLFIQSILVYSPHVVLGEEAENLSTVVALEMYRGLNSVHLTYTATVLLKEKGMSQCIPGLKNNKKIKYVHFKGTLLCFCTNHLSVTNRSAIKWRPFYSLASNRSFFMMV